MWVRVLYNALFPLVLLVLLPGFLVRMVRRGKYRHKFAQRFGFYSARTGARLAALRPVWIHAVSVGEVRVAMKLIGAWKRYDSALEVVLSTTTSTGFALAREQLESDWLEVIYNPLDFLPCVRSALRAIHPSKLVLIEAEVWPNLVAEAVRRNVPAFLVNARLSPRSARRFRAFRALAAPIFNLLEKVCVQFPAEAALWESLGIRSGKIVRTGSIKYDHRNTVVAERDDFAEILQAAGWRPGDPVLLGASTHEGEELVLCRITEELRATFPRLFLLLVPRHFERCRAIGKSLEEAGFRVPLRSLISTGHRKDGNTLLVDSTGELRDWFAFATVAFIGKSLVATGGQNPVEAVLAGKPAVFGPHMENFQILVDQLLDAGGATRVFSEADLQRAIGALLADPAARDRLVTNGKLVLATHRGAADRTVHEIAGKDLPGRNLSHGSGANP